MKLRTKQRLYLREAFAMLVLARLAVRFIAPALLFSWVDRPLRRVNRFAADDIEWISWAIKTMAAKPAMNAFCLPCALAAHAMLRRRGIASRICLAVARDNHELIAHAWVETDKNKIVGHTGGAQFTHIAEFGTARLGV